MPQKRSIKKRTPVKVWTLVIVTIACVMKLRMFLHGDEGLSKVALEIHLTLLNIDLRANWFMNIVNMNHSDFMKFKKKILESLNEYQQKTMIMKVLLAKIKNKDKDLWDKLKDKDGEV